MMKNEDFLNIPGVAMKQNSYIIDNNKQIPKYDIKDLPPADYVTLP
jgi:hypothetical protein